MMVERGRDVPCRSGGGTPPAGSRGIDELLATARARLNRLTPEAGHLAHRRGALLVDIRPAAQRAATGSVPGALVVERNVLEWRFDPRSSARLPIADRYDLPVIVLCQEGYTSSLAAAALQDLGLYRATDIIGGFVAWRIAGLPAFGPTPAYASPAAPAPATRAHP
jgi:rhodanese-related sulfurtransferase